MYFIVTTEFIQDASPNGDETSQPSVARWVRDVVKFGRAEGPIPLQHVHISYPVSGLQPSVSITHMLSWDLVPGSDVAARWAYKLLTFEVLFASCNTRQNVSKCNTKNKMT